MSDQTRRTLLSAAESFCGAFASQAPLEDILGHFSNSRADAIVAHEHGLKQLAPFLGRYFVGPKGVKEYFEILAKHLSYNDMRFSNYVVDPVENKVSMRGEAS